MKLVMTTSLGCAADFAREHALGNYRRDWLPVFGLCSLRGLSGPVELWVDSWGDATEEERWQCLNYVELINKYRLLPPAAE